MIVLELSALPLWAMKGQGGMPSLRETLAGHRRAGHEVRLVMPRYHLFSNELTDLTDAPTEGLDVHFAPCRWFPVLHRLRQACYSVLRRKELPFALRWVLNMATFLLLTASLYLEAMRVVRRSGGRFDLVYAHNQYATLAGRLLGRKLGLPNVNRLYGTFLADLMGKPFVTLRYPVAATGYRVPHDLLICTNDGTRGDEVARRMGIDLDKFRFWQNGVDFPEAPTEATREEVVAGIAEARPEAKWIVSCSRLSYWKRIDRMLRALAVCRGDGVDAQLLIAGDGPERPRLEKLADELGISDDVVWLGTVAHDRIWELMHVADVFMITNDVTNRCNPLYEAMSAGLPVVSVRDASTQDLLEHDRNALLADPDDTDQLGQHLIAVCGDEGLSRRLAQQQARAGQFWSWQERMDAEVRELEALVQGRRRQSKAGAKSQAAQAEASG